MNLFASQSGNASQRGGLPSRSGMPSRGGIPMPIAERMTPARHGPQAAHHPHMARSIVPTLCLAIIGLALTPVDTVMVLFALVVSGWLPVLLG